MSGTQCDCGRPTAGAWLCETCTKTLAYATVNIGVYYLDLGTMAARQARYGTSGATRGSVGKEQPLIVDMRFVSGPPIAAHPGATIAPGTQLRWDAWNTIHSWCRTVMEENPEVAILGPICESCWHNSCTNVRRNRWPRDTVTSMINYLARQNRWVLSQRWVIDMLDELCDLEQRLSRFVDRPADKWYAGKCTVIGGVDICPTELYATIGRGSITCPTCDTEHDIAKRRDDLLDQAKDHLVTATEAAGALLAWTDYSGSELSLIKRISKWRERKVLETRGEVLVNGKERTLYRLGDVQDRMIEDAQRQQARAIPA